MRKNFLIAFIFFSFLNIFFTTCEDSESLKTPFAPTNLTAAAFSSTEINLTWSDLSDNEDGFLIERKNGSNGTYTQIGNVDKNITFYQDSNLQCETTYSYWVRSFNKAGDSEYSNEVTATTESCSVNGIIPIAPSLLQVTLTNSSQIDLSWIDNSNNEDGFSIERKTGSGGTYSQVITESINETSFQDSDLACETTYFYRIAAYNDAGTSEYSNEISAATSTCPSTIPTTPSNLQATAVSSSQINLSWTDNSNNEDGFKIERKTGAGGLYSQISQVNSGITSYQNTGLSSGTTYYYRVRAFNSAGNSSYSNEDSAATQGSAAGSLKATFINVGEGDSALFEFPDGKTMLIDGGNNGHGTSDINPLLAQKSINTLDLMILTHTDADHCGGLDEVLAQVNVLEIWENGDTATTQSYQDFALARDTERATKLIPDKNYERYFGTVKLKVLHRAEGYSDENNNSLVVMVSYGSVDFFMTGDIETEADQELVSEYGSALDCEVIKVPHHGSANFDNSLITNSSPRYAVISVGPNSYGHPSQTAINAYVNAGATVCRTDTSGIVIVTTDGSAINFNCSNPINSQVSCNNGDARQCGSSNVGACKYGTQTCYNGSWGSCVGNIEPTTEICGDGIDQDCNGSDSQCPPPQHIKAPCCDGTTSPSCYCDGSLSGCCSSHGGVCGC